MNADLKFTAVLISAFLCVGLVTPTAAQEGVFLDPATGDYTIRYRGYGGALGDTTFYPQTKIDPAVKSKIRQADDGSIVYRYRVKNGERSKQNLISLRVTSKQAIANSQNTPPGWDPRINPISGIHPIHGNVGNFVGWLFVSKLASSESITSEGLVPGASQEFEFRSLLLPGVGAMILIGDAPVTEFLDEGPDPQSPAGITYQSLIKNDFVPRVVAAPRIAVPTPFDAAVVLAGIQQHIKTDMLSMQLVDAVFISQLDPWFASAIDVAKRNNNEGLRHAIKELRRLLKQEHADVDKDDDRDDDDKEKKVKPRIDKLAARVLDFDFKYLEKRVQGNKDWSDRTLKPARAIRPAVHSSPSGV